jgi:hypothetical protein
VGILTTCIESSSSLSPARSSSPSASNCSNSASSTMASSEACPLSPCCFCFASARRRSFSSSFCLRCSSISARILSLYGKRLGMPGSFLFFERHSGFWRHVNHVSCMRARFLYLLRKLLRLLLLLRRGFFDLVSQAHGLALGDGLCAWRK